MGAAVCGRKAAMMKNEDCHYCGKSGKDPHPEYEEGIAECRDRLRDQAEDLLERLAGAFDEAKRLRTALEEIRRCPTLAPIWQTIANEALGAK